MNKYAGKGWLKAIGVSETSDLGGEVADLLGDAFMGIYHLSYTSLKKVNWKAPCYVAVTIRGELATFDTNTLTILLVLCHDRCLRMAIEGTGPNYLRVSFTKRQRDGQQWARHPTLEDAASMIRNHYEVPNG